jgi:hypothetical protein
MHSPIPFEDLEFVLLNAGHDLSGFCSAEPELDEFLKEDALVNQNNLISVTRLVFWKGNLVGFFTLINDSIEVRAVEACDRKEDYHFRKYPALKIARLATHSGYERFGIGRSMLEEDLCNLDFTLPLCRLPHYYGRFKAQCSRVL